MKISKLTLLVSGALLLTANAAVNAADGTINFTGNIISEACEVDAGYQNQTVILGDVSSQSFQAAGDKSSPTGFQIVLENCAAAISEVTVKFDGPADSGNVELLALNSGETATGVGIEIADSVGNPIPLYAASAPYLVAGGGVTMNFISRYVATAATVGAGSANATSQFTINYQ